MSRSGIARPDRASGRGHAKVEHEPRHGRGHHLALHRIERRANLLLQLDPPPGDVAQFGSHVLQESLAQRGKPQLEVGGTLSRLCQLGLVAVHPAPVFGHVPRQLHDTGLVHEALFEQRLVQLHLFLHALHRDGERRVLTLARCRLHAHRGDLRGDQPSLRVERGTTRGEQGGFARGSVGQPRFRQPRPQILVGRPGSRSIALGSEP